MDTIRSRNILAFTVPLIVSQSVILLNGIIDLAIVGPLGTPAVAVVSVSAAICTVLFNFLEGFRTGTTVLVSGAAALGDEHQIEDVFRTALFLSAATGAAHRGLGGGGTPPPFPGAPAALRPHRTLQAARRLRLVLAHAL